MTQNDEESNTGFLENSKFIKTVLVVITALLIFAGPTYLVYILIKINVGTAASMLSGIVVLILGLILMAFLVRKKIIT